MINKDDVILVTIMRQNGGGPQISINILERGSRRYSRDGKRKFMTFIASTRITIYDGKTRNNNMMTRNKMPKNFIGWMPEAMMPIMRLICDAYENYG